MEIVKPVSPKNLISPPLMGKGDPFLYTFHHDLQPLDSAYGPPHSSDLVKPVIKTRLGVENP